MKNNSWFKQWDEGNFDISEKMNDDSKLKIFKERKEDFKHIKKIEKLEESVFDNIYPILSFTLVLTMIIFFLYTVYNMPPFGAANTPANSSEVIKRYIEQGLSETGAVNIVAGVILDYRAFDTLGESHVLFTAAMVVTLLLVRIHEQEEPIENKEVMEKDTILKVTAKVLTPTIILFGIYVILAGHLGPGGGFSGGSIIGAGLILYSVSFGNEKLKKLITPLRYKLIVMSALMFYSLAKCYSFYCGANHIHSIFQPGTPGRILSAGLILPLNIAVGIVVALTMYGFYSYFTRRHI